MSLAPTSRCPPNRLESWWSLALLLLASLFITYPGLFLGTSTLFAKDFGLFGYPNAIFVKDTLLHGHLPLWDPYNYCGIPFAAQWATMPFYPGNLLFLIMPTYWGLSIFMFLHLIAGGVGMKKLIGQLTGNNQAAFLTGYAFGFSGIALNMLCWPHATATFCYLPWVAYTWLRFQEYPNQRTFGLATLITSLQILTGTPEFILFTWVISSALIVSQAVSLKRWAQTACIPIASLCLTAFQILPFLQLLGNCYRANKNMIPDTVWQANLDAIINLVAPMYHSTLRAYGLYCPGSQGWICSYYIAVAFTVVALVTYIKSRDRRVIALGAISILALFLSSGLFQNLPGLGIMRYPVKYMVLIVFCSTIVAGIGLSTIQFRLRWLIWVALGSLILLAGIAHDTDATASGGARNFAIRAALGLSLLYLFTRPRRYTLIIVCLLMLDTRTHFPELNLTTKAQTLSHLQIDKPIPALGEGRFSQGAANNQLRHYLPEDPTSYFPVSAQVLAPNLNLCLKVPTSQGFFPLVPSYIFALDNYALLDVDPFRFDNARDLLGNTYTSNPQHIDAWVPQPNALPFLSIGQNPISAGFTITALETIDFHANIVLDSPNSPNFSSDANATSQLIKYSAQEIEFTAHTTKPTQVLILQTFYPAWKAYVNGIPTPVQRADYAFQAIAVPAGNSQIVLKYEDTMFQIGLGISGFSGLILLAINLPKRLKKTIASI